VEPYGAPVEVHISGGAAPGSAFFDIEPEFPQQYRCYVLFLDQNHALVLKKTDNAVDEYQRIGIALFELTSSQKQYYYGLNRPDKVIIDGPITKKDERVTVTIV